MRLMGYKKIEGIIEVVTGLHIGGSTAIIEIGGKDNPIIKHPITKEPYIPGSSLKGKMRSLLEWSLGKLNTDPASKDFGEVHSCGKEGCPICVIFGTSAEEAGLGPTRLIVRDAVLDTEYKNEQKKRNFNWTPLDITEDKCENAINRITARANPRSLERVISGVKFSFKMSYKVFEKKDNKTSEKSDDGTSDENLFSHVLNGLRLIEKDALGGAGSRGCGQVSFRIKLAENNWRTLDNVQTTDFKTDPATNDGAVK